MTVGVEAEIEAVEADGAMLERVVGVVIGFDPDGDLLEVDNIHVLPQHLQVQVGLRLMERGIQLLKGQGKIH